MRTAFFVILAILLGTNLINLGRNAESRPYSIANRDSLYAQARDTHSTKIRSTFLVYYFLREHLPRGSKITIPEYLRSHAPRLRRVTGLQVEVAPGPIEVSDLRYKRLRKDWTLRLSMWVRGNYFGLFLAIKKRARHHVIVQESATDRMVLVPYETYLKVLKIPPPRVEPAPFGH